MVDFTKESKTFCLVPFTTLFMGATGENRLCCVATDPILDVEYERNGVVRTRKQMTKVYPKNIQKDVWTSEYFKNIRQLMLNGEEIEECRRCYDIEKSGGHSDRLATTSNLSTIVDDDFSINIETGNNKNTPIDFDIRPSNLCNLKCRMCFSDSSSLIGKEIKDNPILTEIIPSIRDSGLVDWFSDSSMQDQLKLYIPNILRLKILGGETSVIEKVHELLQWCIDNGYNETIVLDVTTNLTNTNDTFFNLLKQFKTLHVCISIDGIGAVNDYIRFPSKWGIIKKNILKYIYELPAENNITMTILSTTTVYNIIYIKELIYWIYNIDDPNKILGNNRIIFCPVYYPSYQHVNLLPRNKRTEIATQISKIVTDLGFNEYRLDISRIRVVIDDLISDNVASDEDYIRFIKSTKAYDTIRKQDLKTSLPEVYEIFKKDFEE